MQISANSKELCCRLWPDDQNFQPTLLGQSATAVAACLIANDSALVWIPEADRPSRSAGSWVSVRQACFLPESQVPDSCVVNVGRRAGLAIPEMPLSTLKVLISVSMSLACIMIVTVAQLHLSRRKPLAHQSPENAACMQPCIST